MYLRREIDGMDVLKMRLALGHAPVCDFCAEEPMYVYASRVMSTGENIGCWRWCACVPCARAIDNYKWTILKSRIASKLREMMPGATEETIRKSVESSLLPFHEGAIVIEPE